MIKGHVVPWIETLDPQRVQVLVDSTVPFAKGILRVNDEGEAQIHVRLATTTDPELLESIIARETELYRLNQFGIFNSVRNSFSGMGFISLVIWAALAAPFFGVLSTAAIESGSIPADLQVNRVILIVYALAFIGFTALARWMFGILIELFKTIIRSTRTLQADRAVVRRGHKAGLVRVLQASSWDFSPTMLLRKICLQKIWS